MAYRPEDLELDEGYWKSLLAEVDGGNTITHSNIGPTPSRHSTTSSDANRIPPSESSPSTIRDRDRRPSAMVSDPSEEELPKLWQALHDAMKKNILLELEVTGVNRGGLIVHYHGLRGFVPSSHLSAVTLDMDEPMRRSTLAEHLGQRLRLRVIELDESQDRAVFSERAEQNNHVEEVTEPPQILREVQAGETRRGRVTNLTAFGAFVDLGGYEGLVHVSELSWSRVGHPRDILTIGQEVDVFVISADPSQGRIALSLKRAKIDPWRGIEHRYVIGQIVQGVVTNVVQFGAFAKVEDDLEGLIHVSELAEGSFLHPRNIVKEGDHIIARVIGVDGKARRLALSLRGVDGE